MEGFSFDEGFALGVAAAAAQIEGNIPNSSWYDWYKKGHIKDGSDPNEATRHYERFREDAALLGKMGIEHYRMGLEWSRLEPEEGVFAEEEFDRYREELKALKSNGVQVLLTLHHFSNPLWFESTGAFLRKDAVAVFLRFVKKAVEELGAYIEEYITVNEPNVYAMNGYFAGSWPPGERSFLKMWRVLNSMGRCHRVAYTLIHRLYEKDGRPVGVSFAHHMRAFDPKNSSSFLQKQQTKLLQWLFQGHITHTYAKKGGRAFIDFWGLNYYSRTAVAGFADGVMENTSRNDLGWEIYPAGIVRCCKELLRTLELPVYITENGTCDNEDAFRARYIYEHLKALKEAELPVRRYYHWCFIDNFEWLEGMSACFGLVDGNRHIKESGVFYTAMIMAGGVTAEMAERYCRGKYKDEA